MSPIFVTTAFGVIEAGNTERFDRIAPSGRFSFITTVFLSGADTEAMLVARNGSRLLTFGSLKRLSEKTTSSAVTGAPFENFASRRWNVIVLPPFEKSHDFARPGCGSSLPGAYSTSWS